MGRVGKKYKKAKESVASKPTPMGEAEAQETACLAHRAGSEALASLEPRLRRILLGTIAGRTQKELGQELHCSQQLIARLLARCTDRLRRDVLQRLGSVWPA